MMSSAVAPASLAINACSIPSLMPSHTTEDTVGQMPLMALAVMRVTSARSFAVSENTSPVCPLVIRPTMPLRRASQVANLASSASSMLWSLRKGTAIAGMMPLKLVMTVMRDSSCAQILGLRDVEGCAAQGLERARELTGRLEQGFDADALELASRKPHGGRSNADRRQRDAIEIEHGGGEHAEAGNVFLVRHGVAHRLHLLQPAQQRVEVGDRGFGAARTRLRFQHLDLRALWRVSQDRVADRGRVHRRAAADANVDAEPHQA